MKKVTAAALTTMVLMSSSAFAAQFPNVDLNGDLKLHYRWNTMDNTTPATPDYEGGKVWFRLNAKTALSDSVDAYARLSVQKTAGDIGAGLTSGADYDQGYSKYREDGATSLDRFGFVVKNKGWNYTVGRQDIFLGTGLFADSTGYMGINMGAIDGIAASGKAGATNLKLIAAKGWFEGSEDDELYAVEASYSPSSRWNVGAVYAKAGNENVHEKLNHYGVNAAYTVGKATVFGEYGKSSADTDDTGYALGVSHGFTNKLSGYVIYSNVEANTPIFGGDGFLTTYDGGGKGMYYGVDYKIDANKTFSLFYKDMSVIDSPIDYTSFRTTLTIKF